MRSFWQHHSFGIRADIAIVGAGIVGCSAALFLKQQRPRQRVVVFERGSRPDGATVKNAGFACFGSPTELLADMEKEGMDAVSIRVEQRWRGLTMLRELLTDENIGYKRCGGSEAFRDTGSFHAACDRLDGLNELLRPILGNGVFHVGEDAELERMNICGIIRNDLEAQVHSGKLMRSLLRICHEAGVEFHFGHAVSSLDEKNDHVVVHISDREQYEADQVLIATNGYTGSMFQVNRLQPARAQVLITEPLRDLPVSGCYHYDRGYYYFRDVGDRVLLGGGRELDIAGETTQEETTTPLIQNALEKLLWEMILPGRDDVRIAQRWSGIMGVGKVKEPMVERMNDHISIAVRLGGMGVAIGCEVGRRAAAVVLGT